MATAAARRTTAPPATRAETLADLVRRLGDIPLDRILLQPAPGKAKEADLVAALDGPNKRICELVDGVLVEKGMGTTEGLLAAVLIQLLWNHVADNDLGVVIGGDGPFRLWLGLVRVPDVSFVSWERIPGGEFPDDPVARLIPDLAVEVLSKSNTKKEMERKLQEYFQAGVRLAWLIQPRTQTAEVFTSPTNKRKVNRDQALDGGDMLPGFRLPLKELFARLRRKPGKGR
jgi:Uma2 family endonuclease